MTHSCMHPNRPLILLLRFVGSNIICCLLIPMWQCICMQCMCCVRFWDWMDCTRRWWRGLHVDTMSQIIL